MPMQGQRGDGCVVPTHSLPDNSRRWVVCITLRLLYSREITRITYTGGWMGLRAGLDGTGIRSLDHPANNGSLD
jgi:hypothetical protein